MFIFALFTLKKKPNQYPLWNAKVAQFNYQYPG